MTYFGFLARFLLIPLGLLAGLQAWEVWRGRSLPTVWRTWPASKVILAHVVVAMLYTTPWDNYLVATSVWWYDPNLVTGYTIGWVPIEEYTFFVLQALLTGTWVVWLMRRWPDVRPFVSRPALRQWSTALVAVLWLISTIVLLAGYTPANYLTLILSWAFLPIMLQLWFGADILAHYGGLVFWGIVPTTLYLAVADALAIRAGTWTISPTQTVNVYLGGILPLEEFLFFLLTNTLVVLGVILVMARQSHQRTAAWPAPLRRWLPDLAP